MARFLPLPASSSLLIVSCLLMLYAPSDAARKHRRQVSGETDPSTRTAVSSPNITRLHIRSEVSLRFATTNVTSHLTNPGQSAAEAVFDVRIPKTAFITKFTMEIDGKNYTGSVKEKETASREYEEAVSRGQSAAQVKKSPRGTDRFHVNVNVAAGSDVTFYLTYQELLTRRHGFYGDSIFVDPGQVVPDLRIEVYINETREITELFVPPLTDNETDATMATLEQNPYATILFITPSEVLVTLTLRPDEQRRNSANGISGRFSVLYDVLRNYDSGDVEVMDGYFVHFFAPNGIPVINKNVMFILDTSGSMYGTKMRQMKDAMGAILAELRPGDYFNIIRFSSDTSMWISETPMVLATQQDKDNAMLYVQELRAVGGTNVNDAVLRGIDVLSQHTNTNENELSSMIIFLTDGDPTVGVTNENSILDNIRSRNEGRFPLYSLGFGRTVNFEFLKRVSLQNNGFARKIYEDADAQLQLEGFFREVSTPLLNDVTFDYVGGVNDSSLTRRVFPVYNMGSEIVVTGRLASPDVTEINSVIHARSKAGPIDMRKPIFCPRPPILPPHPLPEPRPHTPSPIERLWAYMTIQQYMDYVLATTNDTERESYKRKALTLALKYQFVTDLTSMVVVKPNQTESLPSTGDTDQPALWDSNAPVAVHRQQLHVMSSPNNFHPQATHTGLAGPHGGAMPKRRPALQGRGRPSGGAHDVQSGQVGSSIVAAENSAPPSAVAETDQAPNKKHFGYSFADGDPHFLVTVPGSPNNAPLCFNIHGVTGATYILLNDSVNDVFVTGRIIDGEEAQNRRGRRSYFGLITVNFRTLSLQITPQEISLDNAPMTSWEEFNLTINNNENPAIRDAISMSSHLVKLRLDTGAVLVVARHVPENLGQNHKVSYVGFYIENMGLLSGTARGLTGQFAHSRIEDMSRPGSKVIRFTPSDGATGRVVRIRQIMRRNLVTKQHVSCLFVDHNGRDVLRRPFKQYRYTSAG